MYKISAHSEAPLGPIGRSANTIATGVLKTAQKISEQAGHDACLLITLLTIFRHPTFSRRSHLPPLTHTFLAGGRAFKWSSKHGTLIISLLLLSSISLPLFFSFFFFLPELSGAVEAANGHACQDFCFCNLWVFMSIMRKPCCVRY